MFEGAVTKQIEDKMYRYQAEKQLHITIGNQAFRIDFQRGTLQLYMAIWYQSKQNPKIFLGDHL